MEYKETLVSVIVPVYNAERYIAKCVESVLEQTYPEIELIIVDDGSTDATAQLCDMYAEKDTRVHVIHKQNAGVSAARNTGLAAATGVYVVFLDSDDWLDLDIIERAVKNYKKGCINVWGFICHWPKDVITTEKLTVPTLTQCELIANAIYSSYSNEYNLGTYYRATCGKIFERKLIEEKKIGFPEELFIGEDAVFLVKYLTAVSGINLISEKGYNYNHQNTGSATTRYQPTLYEQSECQYQELVKAVHETGLEENSRIHTSFVNFRWWMVASLSANNMKGIRLGKVRITQIAGPAMRWINAHSEEMKEGVENVSEISPAYRHIYQYRKHLNKSTLYVHFFLNKAIKNTYKWYKNGRKKNDR